jgi:hypothetical protein
MMAGEEGSEMLVPMYLNMCHHIPQDCGHFLTVFATINHPNFCSIIKEHILRNTKSTSVKNWVVIKCM